MSVDPAVVRRIAHLARIKVADADLPHLAAELNSILAFVEELDQVDIEGIEPMTSVMPMRMQQRPDVVDDGEQAEAIVANAPSSEDSYFVVPKVIE
jgi:aspartyl-tRNA(Asn)/glutamyl-tRNA(Gln) amidotransferase subunit C